MEYLNKCKLIFEYYVLYMIWISVHFISISLYTCFCVPKTIFQYAVSPITVNSLHCRALHWLQNYSIQITFSGITILTTLFMTMIQMFRIFPNNEKKEQDKYSTHSRFLSKTPKDQTYLSPK